MRAKHHRIERRTAKRWTVGQSNPSHDREVNTETDARRTEEQPHDKCAIHFWLRPGLIIVHGSLVRHIKAFLIIRCEQE